jgi:plasmid stability protein
MAAALSDRIMVRLSPDDRRRLAVRAAAEGRKDANLARHLIRQGLDREEAMASA